MFDDLFGYVTSLFSWRWPVAQGVVTNVEVMFVPSRFKPGRSVPKVEVAYTFSVGDDGPYTGETIWTLYWTASPKLISSIQNEFGVNKPVTVRYLPKDPSVNKLDRSTWQDFVDDL